MSARRHDGLRSAGLIRSSLRLLMAVICSLTMFACNNPNEGKFRYRLSFSVKVNGEVKSASSIIEIRYWGGKGGMTTSAVTAFSEWKGVAPVIDLGPRGWLIAAMFENNALFERLKGPNPPSCREKADAAGFPLVFGKSPKDLAQMTEAKERLPESLYPAFIWVPPNASYLNAKPVCPAELSSVIGQNVTLQSVTIEVAKGAQLLTLQPFKAAWLDEIRAEQGERYSGGPYFKLVRQRQLETETIKEQAARREY